MPVKHATSHAFGTLAGIILAGLLVSLATEHLPKFRGYFNGLAVPLTDRIALATGLTISPEILGVGLLATVLAAMWGVVFARLHHD